MMSSRVSVPPTVREIAADLGDRREQRRVSSKATVVGYPVTAGTGMPPTDCSIRLVGILPSDHRLGRAQDAACHRRGARESGGGSGWYPDVMAATFRQACYEPSIHDERERR